jgi:hypothetical protein
MMGRQTVDQSQLFCLFNLERRIPERYRASKLDCAVWPPRHLDWSASAR